MLIIGYGVGNQLDGKIMFVGSIQHFSYNKKLLVNHGGCWLMCHATISGNVSDGHVGFSKHIH